MPLAGFLCHDPFLPRSKVLHLRLLWVQFAGKSPTIIPLSFLNSNSCDCSRAYRIFTLFLKFTNFPPWILVVKLRIFQGEKKVCS
jgi:hypothetical protein